MLTTLLYAEAPAAAAPAVQGPSGGMFGQMIPLILIFVIFYFLLIRPQQKRAKEHQKLIDNIQKGEQVMTSGGIYGTVVGLKGHMIELKIAENVNIRLLKSAIANVIKDDKAVEAEVVAKK